MPKMTAPEDITAVFPPVTLSSELLPDVGTCDIPFHMTWLAYLVKLGD
jgi:hypothetical protein